MTFLFAAYLTGCAWGYWFILMDTRGAIGCIARGDLRIALCCWAGAIVVGLAIAPLLWPAWAFREIQQKGLDR